MAGKKNGVELAKAYVQIIPSMEGVQQNIENALNGGGGVGDIGSRAGNALGGAFSAAFTKAAGFLKDSIDTGMGFDAAMSQVAATMGTSVDKITELRDKAKEMGAATNYSATQAAEGLNILAMSGYDAEHSMDMLGDVLHLAAAGGMEMSEAAGDISGAMKGFGDASKDSAYYADLMAKGATLANTSVSQLGQALADGSSMGKAYSQSAEGMTVSLLRLAEQGETGSAAATALSAAYANIYTPMDQAKQAMDELGVSAYDSTGATRDFNTVINELNEAIQREANGNEAIANQYKDLIFGKQGLNAYNKLVVTSTETQEQWTQTLRESTGSAAQQYDTMTDNLAGDMDKMKSAFEGLQIEISEELTDDVRGLVQVATEGLTWLTEHSTDLIGTIKAIGVAALAMNLPSILGAAKAAMLAFNAACAANPLGLALSAFSAGVIFISTQIDKMTDQINEIPDPFEGLDAEQVDFVKKLAEGTDDLAEAEKRCAEAEEMFRAAQDKRTALQDELASAQEELHAINEKWVITQEEKLRRQELENTIIPELTANIKHQNAAVGELGAAYVTQADNVRSMTEAQEQLAADTEAATIAEQEQAAAEQELAVQKEQLAERVKQSMKDALTVDIELSGQTVELSRTTAESVGQIIDSYDEMYEKQKQVVEGSFDLWNGFTADTSLSFEQLYNNVVTTQNGMTEWARNIEKLEAAGLDKGLIEQLRLMGEDGYKYVHALASGTEEQLKQYNDAWLSAQTTVENVTKRVMAGEKETVEAELSTMLDVPNAKLEEVRKAFEGAGLAGIGGYEKAITDYIAQKDKAIDKLVDDQIDALIDSEDDWETVGEKLPEALAAGMKNSLELGAIDEATTAVANEVISGLNAKLSAGGVSGLGFGFDSSVLDKAANSSATYAAARSGSDEANAAPTTLQIVTPDGQTLAEWLFPKINDLFGKTTILQLRGYART